MQKLKYKATRSLLKINFREATNIEKFILSNERVALFDIRRFATRLSHDIGRSVAMLTFKFFDLIFAHVSSFLFILTHLKHEK